jgi:acyl CoA:acetate/3-ketoacid CoA transferase beta subunit
MESNLNNGASRGSDFQPPTQNPQALQGGGLQTTGTGLQSPAGNVLDAKTNILVPTPSGTVAIPPQSIQQATAAQPAATLHTQSWLVWVGIGLVLLIAAYMAIGILRPRKYS